MEPEIQKRNEAIQQAKLYIENAWIAKYETPEYFLLTKNDALLIIHVLIAAFLGWWTFFIPNIVYHMMMNRRIKISKYGTNP